MFGLIQQTFFYVICGVIAGIAVVAGTLYWTTRSTVIEAQAVALQNTYVHKDRAQLLRRSIRTRDKENSRKGNRRLMLGKRSSEEQRTELIDLHQHSTTLDSIGFGQL